MKVLSGYKTYITAALLVILSGLRAQGYIDDHMYQSLLALLTGLGLAALRAAITTGTK